MIPMVAMRMDDAFVGRRVETGTEGAEDEEGKNEHIRHRNDVVGLGIDARRGVGPGERVGGGQNAEEDHETGEQEASDTETAMDVDAACSCQGGLSDEQDDPHSKGSAVKVNNSTGEWAMKNAGEIIGVGKTKKDGGENQQRHSAEKKK
ncbi:MAG TPA: hypothetical protein VMI32_07745 [Candidatus Solibacter sp.]|nr:hypothetical protein [Candidatus Solibacter sp.]